MWTRGQSLGNWNYNQGSCGELLGNNLLFQSDQQRGHCGTIKKSILGTWGQKCDFSFLAT